MKNEKPKYLTFFGHLDEFKDKLIKCVVAFLFASCVCYLFIDQLLGFIVAPVGYLIFTAPAEAFATRINLTFFCGFLLALPYILAQIWQFISLGLKDNEKKYIRIFGPLSLICFFVGAVFSYTVMVPISMRFLLSFSSDAILPMITINKYISFVGMLILAFGFIFELPLVMWFLTKIGIATPAFLIQKRKHAIIMILVTSALITPPDVVTLMLMSVPLIFLYELGIIASKLTYQVKEVQCK